MCAFGAGWSWSLLFWYAQGALTLVIAGAVGFIAYQQWQTNARKLKLDLFDRRFKTFQAVRDILGMMYTTVSDDKKLYELLNQTRDAEFLFGTEIKDYIEGVWRHATRLSDTHRHLNQILETAPPETRKKLADVETEEVQWALAETRVIADKFKKHLDLSKL